MGIKFGFMPCDEQSSYIPEKTVKQKNSLATGFLPNSYQYTASREIGIEYKD